MKLSVKCHEVNISGLNSLKLFCKMNKTTRVNVLLKIMFEPTHMQQIHHQMPTLKMTLPNSFKGVDKNNR